MQFLFKQMISQFRLMSDQPATLCFSNSFWTGNELSFLLPLLGTSQSDVFLKNIISFNQYNNSKMEASAPITDEVADSQRK